MSTIKSIFYLLSKLVKVLWTCVVFGGCFFSCWRLLILFVTIVNCVREIPVCCLSWFLIPEPRFSPPLSVRAPTQHLRNFGESHYWETQQINMGAPCTFGENTMPPTPHNNNLTGNSNVYGFSSFHGHYSCLKLHKSLNDNMGVIVTAFLLGMITSILRSFTISDSNSWLSAITVHHDRFASSLCSYGHRIVSVPQ